MSAFVIKPGEHERIGEEDRVVQERLGDHQCGTEDRAFRVFVEHQPQQRQIPVILLGDQDDGVTLIDLRENLPILLSDLLDVPHRLKRFCFAAMSDEPAGAFRKVAPHQHDHGCERRADEEGHAPARVYRQRVEEHEGRERAHDRPGPVGAVDPDIDPPAVPRRHHLVDRRVDGRVLAPDAAAGNEPGDVQVDEPACPGAGERRKPSPNQVDGQGPHEQASAPELVGKLPEYQRPDHLAEQVDGSGRRRLCRCQVQGVGLRENRGDRTGDRDRQPVQDPRGAEPENHPSVERRPAHCRDGAADRLRCRGGAGGGGAHSDSLPGCGVLEGVAPPPR